MALTSTDKQVSSLIINKVPSEDVYQQMIAQNLVNDDEIYIVQDNDKTTIEPATATPQANGTASVGTSLKYAREDHVHPKQEIPVKSVNGKTGAVSLIASDVGAISSTLTGTAGQVLTKTASGQEWKDAASPQPSTTTPLAPTEAGSVGTSAAYARGDHVHPRDATKQAKINVLGLLKGYGDGSVVRASPRTDYVEPSYLNTKLNRTTNVNAADTDYTKFMARGESLNAAEVTPAVNGAIAWVYG